MRSEAVSAVGALASRLSCTFSMFISCKLKNKESSYLRYVIPVLSAVKLEINKFRGITLSRMC